MAGIKIQNLREENFKDFISVAGIPVLVDFWAEWCGPCKMIAPVIEEVTKEYEDKIRVGKVNVDENQNVTSALKVSSIPTLIIFKNGREMERSIGFKTKNEVKKLIEKYL